MSTNRSGWVRRQREVDVAAAGVASAQHHIAGQHRLQGSGVDGVERHRDHRELDFVATMSPVVDLGTVPPTGFRLIWAIWAAEVGDT